jgi:F420H(2)-dependent quinone reductase
VEVQVGRQRKPGTARVIESSDPDYGRAWGLVNANNHDRYTAYQKQTSRPIPVIAIAPGQQPA